jgi:putative RNA 2'-phosphotransferase
MMNYLLLSKEISYALRHAPWEYELELDENGWVNITQLIEALKENNKWHNITKDDLVKMIDLSDKKRHEIINGKIRALYGHSTPNKIIIESKQPPEILYHGTAHRFMRAIKENGLFPQARQYVHLSADVETAIQVGKRRDHNPVLLLITARVAWNDGVIFYYANEKVWLVDFISYKYISEI